MSCLIQPRSLKIFKPAYSHNIKCVALLYKFIFVLLAKRKFYKNQLQQSDHTATKLSKFVMITYIQNLNFRNGNIICILLSVENSEYRQISRLDILRYFKIKEAFLK